MGLRMRVYGRAMCFVNCHFAAHLEAVNRRNADFDHVYRTMVFNRPSNLLNAAAGMVPYLFLSCSLACSAYLFWLLYSSGLPFILSVAAGVSSVGQMLRVTNVSNLWTNIIKLVNLQLYYYMVSLIFYDVGVVTE